MNVTNFILANSGQVPNIVPGWPDQYIQSNGTDAFWNFILQSRLLTDATGFTLGTGVTEYLSFLYWKADATENNVKASIYSSCAAYMAYGVYVESNTADQPVTMTLRVDNADIPDSSTNIPVGFTGWMGKSVLGTSAPNLFSIADKSCVKLVAPGMSGSVVIKGVFLELY